MGEGRHVGRKEAADWTLNEVRPSFDDLELGMLHINDLKPEVVKEKLPTPKVIKDIPFEEQFDHTDNGQWWNNRKKKTPPNTAAMDKWIEQQGTKHSGTTVLVLLIIAIAGILAGVSIVIQ